MRPARADLQPSRALDGGRATRRVAQPQRRVTPSARPGRRPPFWPWPVHSRRLRRREAGVPSPEAFDAFIRTEHAKRGPVVREAGIRIDG